jgi:predicted SAM-dependent methyltransferase
MTLRYVNLGCGSRFHPEWINIDLSPADPSIIAYDIYRGIPLPDNSCEVVYHSHVLEHLRRPDVLPFLRECLRVLQPQGVMRLATPDLESMVRQYLKKLEMAYDGDLNAGEDYEWLLLELYDQTVREQSGGAMGEYLSRTYITNEEFVYDRIGETGRQIVAAQRQQRNNVQYKSPSFVRGKLSLIRHPFRTAQNCLVRFLLSSKDRRALQIGRFRLSGEIHHELYDRYSLTQLLTKSGFLFPIVQSAYQSHIPNWTSFNLDTLPGGGIYKPDSIFMEAFKPS